jgi:hypothetical protein
VISTFLEVCTTPFRVRPTILVKPGLAVLNFQFARDTNASLATIEEKGATVASRLLYRL